MSNSKHLYISISVRPFFKTKKLWVGTKLTSTTILTKKQNKTQDEKQNQIQNNVLMTTKSNCLSIFSLKN